MNEPEDQRPGLTEAQFWHYYQRYPYLLAKVGLWGIVVGGFWWAFTNVQAVLFPVLVSMLIAYLLDPAVDWLEEICDRVDLFRRLEVSRTMAIVVFMIVILSAVIGFILVLYPALSRQVGTLTEKFPQIIELIEGSLIPWFERTFDYKLPPDIASAMAEYGDTIREQLPQVAKKASEWAGSVVTQTGAVVASVLNIVMIPLFSFYFLRDFDRMTTALTEYVPLARREFYTDRIKMMDEVVGAWFRGQVTVALILAVLYSAGLAVVFGFADIGTGTGIAIGILAGVLNIIPYFGFLIGFLLSVLMVLLDWGGWWPLLGVVGVFSVVQLLEGYIITPKIVGEKVGLSPVMVIIVLLLGGELFGLLGVLLAIPVAGILRTLLPDFVSYYKKMPFYSGNYAADEAAARAAHGSYRVRDADDPDSDDPDDSAGLEEQTDGTLDEVDLIEDDMPDPESLKRPITGADARAGERVEKAPAPMDSGTDGDVQDDEPAVDADDGAPEAEDGGAEEE